MGKKTRSYSEMEEWCQQLNLDVDQVRNRSKSLLKLYRKVAWAAQRRSGMLQSRITNSGLTELQDAMIYLTEFAPEKEARGFEDEVFSLFETKWLLELIEYALLKVKTYTSGGELYYDILVDLYVDKNEQTDTSERMRLHLERTAYYNRKNEAVLLFGIALWGYELPDFLETCRQGAKVGMSSEQILQMLQKNRSYTSVSDEQTI